MAEQGMAGVQDGQPIGGKGADGKFYLAAVDATTGALAVSATVSASIATTANASAPTLVEGSTTNPISADLSANLRVIDAAAVATLGATSGAAVVTDAAGTIQQYLRGLIKQWIAGTLVVGSGQAIIGNVGGKTTSVSVTPTLGGTTYGTNYSVGGVLTFANAFSSTGSGILQSVSVNSKKINSNQLYFVPFASAPANAIADNAAAAINVADFDKVRAPIALNNSSILAHTPTAQPMGLVSRPSPGRPRSPAS